MLSVVFVRRRGRRDRVYVTREDGTSISWDFPSYGDGLPQDLCHLVVESELGLTDGFWGLVDQGVDVGLVNNQATLLRSSRPLANRPASTSRGYSKRKRPSPRWLVRRTGSVTSMSARWAPSPRPSTRSATGCGSSPSSWRKLDDGAAITLQYRGSSA